MESAITSRDTSEYFMPSLPFEMPSETVIVLKTIALPPFAFTPFSVSSASLSMCMLHGVTLLQVEATPMIGFLKSASVNPTGYNIARAAARSGPSTSKLENGRIAFGFFADVFVFIGSTVYNKPRAGQDAEINVSIETNGIFSGYH